MKVLITGITGMIGSHFANATRAQGWETFGIARSSSSSRLTAMVDENVIRCDILDRDALEDVFSQVKPDLIVHLAAQAFNSISWKTEGITHQTNYFGTANVLHCCRRVVPGSKVLLACSSAEYGDVKPEDCPLQEDRPLRPITPYGVSKAASECLGYQYFANYDMPVFLPRLFIHLGAGHPPATAVQNFARQLALIAKGRLSPVVKVGALNTARDFIDVRDGVAGMMTMLEKGRPGYPVNVCTGKAFKISEILEMLVEISGLSVEVVFDPSLRRPSDEPLLLGDNTRLKSLGWQPHHTIKQTLETIFRDWLCRI